jgi:glycine oxidase
MPHSPERWNGKKDFQFRALVDLEDEVARLQSETGLPCGYKRVGRLLPLPPSRRANGLGQYRRSADQLGRPVQL